MASVEPAIMTVDMLLGPVILSNHFFRGVLIKSTVEPPIKDTIEITSEQRTRFNETFL